MIFYRKYRKEKIFSIVAIVILLLGGCASLPPETITSQEKIGSGIETARNNQLLLIENFIGEAKTVLRLKAKNSIKRKVEEKNSYTQNDVESLLTEYSADIESELKSIDDKKLQLITETNKFFNELSLINNQNLQLLIPAVEISELYKINYNKTKDIICSKIPENINKK